MNERKPEQKNRNTTDRQTDRDDKETCDGEGLCGPGPKRRKVGSLYTWIGRVVVNGILER